MYSARALGALLHSDDDLARRALRRVHVVENAVLKLREHVDALRERRTAIAAQLNVVRPHDTGRMTLRVRPVTKHSLVLQAEHLAPDFVAYLDVPAHDDPHFAPRQGDCGARSGARWSNAAPGDENASTGLDVVVDGLLMLDAELPDRLLG